MLSRYGAYDVEKYGMLGQKDPIGYRQIPFWTRLSTTSNFTAFFFGPFYFLFKGMWKLCISYYFLVICFMLALSFIIDDKLIMRGVGTGFNFLAMYVANIGFYRKKTC